MRKKVAQQEAVENQVKSDGHEVEDQLDFEHSSLEEYSR